jgi:serine protease Do
VLGDRRQGAGVVVAPDQILTAHYLVMGARKIEVLGPDGRELPVHRVAVDHWTGLALLTVEGAGLCVPSLGLDTSLAPGEPVFIVTMTDERERKGATGHVLAVEPFETYWEYMLDDAIFTTIVNPGMAGAPLLDTSGTVVGLVTLGLAAVGRYSLAIPLTTYGEAREAMREGRSTAPGRAWMGIYPRVEDGALVITGLVPEGPAVRAGVQRGDSILSVDGLAVPAIRDLYREVWKRRVGDEVHLLVQRESDILVVVVIAGDRDEFYR